MTRHATYKERIQVHTLQDTGWTVNKIAQYLHLSIRQVQYLITQPCTPAKRSRRPLKIVTPLCCRLVDLITNGKRGRRMPFIDIRKQIDTEISTTSISRALLKEGIGRRVACKKPFLSTKAWANCLKWAQEHAHWTVEDWRKVLWTDESSMSIVGNGRTWVTRRANEEYYEACIISKFKKLSRCII